MSLLEDKKAFRSSTLNVALLHPIRVISGTNSVPGVHKEW